MIARFMMMIRYSAALCRGLIEASSWEVPFVFVVWVFRGFMPRPH